MTWNWQNAITVGNRSYTCGYCGNKVAPNIGYFAEHSSGAQVCISICPNCEKPTFHDMGNQQTPKVRLGNDVDSITDIGVKTLYDQARDCSSLGAYTATTLLCRKILMNLAVQHGADEGKSFFEYIDFLNSRGYVPPNGSGWVDRIRTKGNEATHEIRLIDINEASQILKFTEMLLKFAYEFPSMLGKD